MPPARPWPSRRRGPASAHHTTCPLSAICARRVMRGASSPPPATAPPWRPPGDARASSPPPATAPPWRPPGDARGVIAAASDRAALAPAG
jgi:hypothetical protein